MRALALLLLACVALPASAQVSAKLADLRLATAVRLALVAEAETRGLDVAVAAADGAVTLSGDVPAALRPVALATARRVPGVRAVAGLGVAAEPPRERPAAVPPRAPATSDPPPPSAGGAAFHVVERGDTVFSLARRYGTTVAAILALNGLDAPDIRVGQRLRVR